MTFEIIKPSVNLNSTNAVVQDGIDALITGLVDGTVVDIHTAVECVNAELGTNLNGARVRPYFKALYKELKGFDAKADELARDGKGIPQIVTALSNYEDNFKISDLQKMKVEVYGSVAEWLEAMQGE